jgi:hypothetical protein
VSPAGPGEDIRVVAPGGEPFHSPSEAQPAAPQESRQHLRLIEQRAARRANRRRLAFSLGIAGAAAVCLALVALHVLIAENQFRLDQLHDRATADQVAYEKLRLQVAQLEAPARIVSEAEGKFGMVQPGSVTYLPAIAPSQSAQSVNAQSVNAQSVNAQSVNAQSVNAQSTNGKVTGNGQTSGQVAGRRPENKGLADKAAGQSGAGQNRSGTSGPQGATGTGSSGTSGSGSAGSGSQGSGPPVTGSITAPAGDADWPSIKPYLSGNP